MSSLESARYEENLISMDEIREHNSRESPWIVIDGVVYDVGSYLDRHPGGRGILLQHAGTDASEAFHGEHRHSLSAIVTMKNLRIGKIADTNGTNSESLENSKVRRRKKEPLKPGFGPLDWAKVLQRIPQKPLRKNISMDEISQHGPDSEQPWIVVKGFVYDISTYLDYHPGGKSILKELAGTDATEAFSKKNDTS